MNASNYIQIKLVAFGKLQEIIGSSSILITCEPNLESCKEYLINKHPELAHQTIKYAVNLQLVSSHVTLRDGDEIALLPPFSGG